MIQFTKAVKKNAENRQDVRQDVRTQRQFTAMEGLIARAGWTGASVELKDGQIYFTNINITDRTAKSLVQDRDNNEMHKMVKKGRKNEGKRTTDDRSNARGERRGEGEARGNNGRNGSGEASGRAQSRGEARGNAAGRQAARAAARG